MSKRRCSSCGVVQDESKFASPKVDCNSCESVDVHDALYDDQIDGISIKYLFTCDCWAATRDNDTAVYEGDSPNHALRNMLRELYRGSVSVEQQEDHQHVSLEL